MQNTHQGGNPKASSVSDSKDLDTDFCLSVYWVWCLWCRPCIQRHLRRTRCRFLALKIQAAFALACSNSNILPFFPFKIWPLLTFLWTAICFRPHETKSVHRQIWLKVLYTFSPLSGNAITGICGIGFSLDHITFSFSHGMMRPWCVVGSRKTFVFLQVWGLLWLWYETTQCLQQFAFIGAAGFTQIVGFHAMQDRAAGSICYVISIMQIKAGLKLRLFGDLL